MPYKYPLEMADSAPKLYLRSKDKNQATIADIVLYMPQALAFTDGAGYGNFDLGIIGTAGANKVNEFVGGKFNAENGIDTNAATALMGSMTGGDSKFLAINAMSKAGIGGGAADRLAAIYGYTNKIAFNPNTVLQFTSMEVRGYSFEVRMIANSREESLEVFNIITMLRDRMYPEAQNNQPMLLEYPDTWQITFDTGGGGESTNNFIPLPADCFLVNMSTIYNSGSNSYHADGSPVDVTLQLQFREFRALKRNDIRKLASGTRIEIGQ